MVAHPLTHPLPPAQTPLPAPSPRPSLCVCVTRPRLLLSDYRQRTPVRTTRAHRFRARVRVPCARAGSWPSSPLCCLLRTVPRFAPPVPRFAPPEASTRVLEPLCAHARDTRGLRSPPRTLPTPYRPIEQCSIYRTWPGQTKVGTQLS